MFFFGHHLAVDFSSIHDSTVLYHLITSSCTLGPVYSTIVTLVRFSVSNKLVHKRRRL